MSARASTRHHGAGVEGVAAAPQLALRPMNLHPRAAEVLGEVVVHLSVLLVRSRSAGSRCVSHVLEEYGRQLPPASEVLVSGQFAVLQLPRRGRRAPRPRRVALQAAEEGSRAAFESHSTLWCRASSPEDSW